MGQPGPAFCTDHAELAVGRAKAQVLLLLDETSRFNLGWRLSFQKNMAQAVELIQEAAQSFGQPLLVKTDNAPEFREEFRSLIGALGLFHLKSPYYYAPFNGKVERVIRELKNYLGTQAPAMTLAELEAQMPPGSMKTTTCAATSRPPPEVLLERKKLSLLAMM